MNSIRKKISVSELQHWCVCCGMCALSSCETLPTGQVLQSNLCCTPVSEWWPDTQHLSLWDTQKSLADVSYPPVLWEVWAAVMNWILNLNGSPQPSLKPILVTTSGCAVSFVSSPQCTHITRRQVHVQPKHGGDAGASCGSEAGPETETGEGTGVHNITLQASWVSEEIFWTRTVSTRVCFCYDQGKKAWCPCIVNRWNDACTRLISSSCRTSLAKSSYCSPRGKCIARLSSCLSNSHQSIEKVPGKSWISSQR